MPNKQPIDLIIVKGRKHLTKAEIEERKNTEVKAPPAIPEAPEYLNVDQKKKFIETATVLYSIGIMSELDSDTLALYIDSYTNYLKYREMADVTIRKIEKAKIADKPSFYSELRMLENLRDKTIKQCRMLASDLGLTITSRCRLVIPKAPEPEKKNKFERFRLE